jgi:hypothetical protein
VEHVIRTGSVGVARAFAVYGTTRSHYGNGQHTANTGAERVNHNPKR